MIRRARRDGREARGNEEREKRDKKILMTYSICHQKFFVIERTRDLKYLKFVATDFYPKTISPSAGENSGDLA